MNLNTQILIAAILGIAFGFLLNQFPQTAFFDHSIYGLSILSSIFIGLLKMLLVPLIFSSIVVGVSNLQSGGQLSRTWKITLLCCVTTTTLALMLGIGAAHLFGVGQGVDIAMFQDAMNAHQTPDTLTPSAFFTNFIQNTLINPFKAFSDGNVLAVVVFALMLGVALVKGGERFNSIKKLSTQFFEVMMMLVGWVMKLAPIGIFGLVAVTFADSGLATLNSYAHLLAVLLGTMAFVALVINPILVFIVLRKNPYPLVFKCLKESGITAFFTRSSAANIPVNLDLARRLGVREATAGIAIPLGATVNMAGAAVTITVLTLATVSTLGIPVDLVTMLILSVVATVSACGASGVAGGSLLLIPVACGLFGISSDIAMQVVAIGLVIGVLQDSAETALNSSTDVLFTAAVDLGQQ